MRKSRLLWDPVRGRLKRGVGGQALPDSPGQFVLQSQDLSKNANFLLVLAVLDRVQYEHESPSQTLNWGLIPCSFWMKIQKTTRSKAERGKILGARGIS